MNSSTASDALTAWAPASAGQIQLRDSFVAHLVRHEDGLSKGCFPDHLTAGALVISHDGSQVLLNLHRKAGRWFHFGGHIEDSDISLAAAALREATEESGIEGLVLDPAPVHLSAHDVEFCSPHGTVRHLDVRYVARVPAGTDPSISEESLDVRWFPIDALPTDEPDMLELISLARA